MREKEKYIWQNILVWLIIPLIAMAVYAIVGLIVFRSCVKAVDEEPNDTLSIEATMTRDTIYVEIHDTVPVFKKERVVYCVKIPADSLLIADDTLKKDSSLYMLPVVQREYSDDSTYTAYVSGLRYGNWPRLDSINVRQRTVMEMTEKTITIQKRPSRWSVGFIGGYGYGMQHGNFEPFVGIGISYRLWPP